MKENIHDYYKIKKGRCPELCWWSRLNTDGCDWTGSEAAWNLLWACVCFLTNSPAPPASFSLTWWFSLAQRSTQLHLNPHDLPWQLIAEKRLLNLTLTPLSMFKMSNKNLPADMLGAPLGVWSVPLLLSSCPFCHRDAAWNVLYFSHQHFSLLKRWAQAFCHCFSMLTDVQQTYNPPLFFLSFHGMNCQDSFSLIYYTCTWS